MRMGVSMVRVSAVTYLPSNHVSPLGQYQNVSPLFLRARAGEKRADTSRWTKGKNEAAVHVWVRVHVRR